MSLISCLGKCLENILTVILNDFIEHNNIIDREQEGFRKFNSTTSALLRQMELNMQPLEIRRMELSVREAGRILSKDVDVPIKIS